MTSPTQRTIAELKRLGYIAPAIVEKWVQFPPPGHRVDLWTWCDIVAIGTGAEELLALHQFVPRLVAASPPRLLFIQCTTQTGVSKRLAKIRAWEHLPALLATGARVEVWGWAKRGERGKRKLWSVKRIPVTLLESECYPNGGDEPYDDQAAGNP
jgi:hypothetical protein